MLIGGEEFPSKPAMCSHAILRWRRHHHKRAEVDAYLARLAAWREQRYQKAQANPSPVVQRLRAIKAERQKARMRVQ
ncbi:MAG: hypothetical protein ACRENG_10540 [bacterium]